MTSGLPDYYVDDDIAGALQDPTSVQIPLSAVSYAYGEDALFERGDKFVGLFL